MFSTRTDLPGIAGRDLHVRKRTKLADCRDAALDRPGRLIDDVRKTEEAMRGKLGCLISLTAIVGTAGFTGHVRREELRSATSVNLQRGAERMHVMKGKRLFVVTLLGVALSWTITGCSGGSAAPPQSAPAVAVSVSPVNATVNQGATQTFTASVTGTTNTAVTWGVQEGAAGGSITTAGIYTRESSSSPTAAAAGGRPVVVIPAGGAGAAAVSR